MTSSAVNLVMTVIGFTVSTIFIVFVCTRLICAGIQYLTRRRSSAYTSRSDLNIVDENLTNLDLEKKQQALSLIQRNRCCLDAPDQLFRQSWDQHSTSLNSS